MGDPLVNSGRGKLEPRPAHHERISGMDPLARSLTQDSPSGNEAYGPHPGPLLPGFVGDALDPAVPGFFIDDVVEAMDLTALEARYAAQGEHAYPPRLLLGLWLFGVIAGVYSGRELARRRQTDAVTLALPVEQLRTPGRYLLEVRTDERSALPLRRFAIVVR